MKFTIRNAVPDDSGQLVELTGLTPMKGTIGLRIDRKPDFFKLLQQSESYLVLVAANENNEIKGCFAYTRNKVWVENKSMDAYYLRDLKVHPGFKGSAIAYLLVKKMYERLMSMGADILYCTSAAGNDAVMPFFQGRVGIPRFIAASTFNVYEILPAKNSKYKNKISAIGKPMLAGFLNDHFKHYSFRPHKIQPGVLNSCVNFSYQEDGNIVALVSAFDTSACKQNIVTSYSLVIGLLLSVMRLLQKVFPFPPVPKKNEPLKIIYARYYAFEKGKEHYLKTLLNQVRYYAFRMNYHFVSIAVDEKDIQTNRLLKPLSSFVFRSTLMVTSLQGSVDVIEQIKNGINFEDYALV